MTQAQFSSGGNIFALLYLLLPLLFASIHVSITKPKDKVEVFFLYYLVIGVGAQGILGGLIQLFNPEMVAAYVGWPNCPFLAELALANICFGILGVLSIWIVGQWRLATAIGYGLFLLFAGLHHIVTALGDNNSAMGNVGPVLWADFLIPLALAILMFMRRKRMYPSS